MKYIKTKDGIYEVLEERKLPMGDETYYVTACKKLYSHEVLHRADDLEVLFDEYVMENKDHTYQTLLQSVSGKIPLYDCFAKDVKDEWISSCDKCLQSGYEIYGAIIVRGDYGEPILKPVAKMKADGGWELL